MEEFAILWDLPCLLACLPANEMLLETERRVSQ